MARITSEGKCNLCGKTFGKVAMTRHLTKCQAEHPDSGRTRVFHVLVEAYRVYWLHIEIPAAAKLARLDKFLRGIWLECCGHLSAFTIAGETYDVAPEPDPWSGRKPRSMSIALENVLRVGDKFAYEYDFGTTTALTLKVMGERMGALKSNDVRILARNAPPEMLCVVCGKPATQICTMCMGNDTDLVCDEHAEEHECGDEYFLPVVNSPRVGMCGYTG